MTIELGGHQTPSAPSSVWIVHTVILGSWHAIARSSAATAIFRHQLVHI